MFSGSKYLHQSSTSSLSVAKQSAAWNTLDAGDQYDIKKSMIAKLPGDNKFMGDSLELILLFQGAQIQRLNESLQDYKIKYNQLSKVELDRHYFEIQIKQLSEFVSESKNTGIQNQKLKQVIRKLTRQIQQLRRRCESTDVNINRNYQQALRKIQIMIKQKQFLIDELQNSKRKNLNQQTQLQNTRIKLKQIDEYQKRTYQYDNRISILSQQVQRLNVVLEQKNHQIKLSSKQLSELKSRLKVFIQDNQQTKIKFTQFTQSNKRQYENKISMLSQQKQKLNKTLEQSNIHTRQSTGQLTELRSRLSIINNQKQQQKIKFLHLTQQLQHMKSQNNILLKQNSQLILQLNNSTNSLKVLQTSQSELTLYKTKIIEYEKKVLSITQQFEKLNIILQEQKVTISELQQLNYNLQIKLKQLQSFDEHNKVLGTEIDRLNQVIKMNENQLSQLRLRIVNQTALTKRINQHLALFVVLFAQIQSLRLRVKDSQKQLQNVRRSSLLPFRKKL